MDSKRRDRAQDRTSKSRMNLDDTKHREKKLEKTGNEIERIPIALEELEAIKVSEFIFICCKGKIPRKQGQPETKNTKNE